MPDITKFIFNGIFLALCLLYGINTLNSYRKEKNEITLYLAGIFIISSIAYVFYIISNVIVFIMGSSNATSSFYLLISQSLATLGALFALYFGVQFGNEIGAISPKFKKYGIIFFIIVEILLVPMIPISYFSYSESIFLPVMLVTLTASFFQFYAYGIPAGQFRKLKKEVFKRRKQINTIFWGYVTWIIYFFVIYLANIISTLDTSYAVLTNILDIIATIINIFALTLLFLGIYLPKFKKNKKNI